MNNNAEKNISKSWNGHQIFKCVISTYLVRSYLLEVVFGVGLEYEVPDGLILSLYEITFLIMVISNQFEIDGGFVSYLDIRLLVVL